MDLGGFKDLVKDLTQGAEKRAVSKALKLFAKGELERAIDVLREAREQSPENADILFDLARYQILAGRGQEGAEALRTLLRRDARAYPRANEMIEELRAKHAHVSPLYDAVADHFIRHDHLKQALEALERMQADEIKAFAARHRLKWESLRKSAPEARMAKPSLQSAYYLALASEALRDYEQAGTIYRTVARNNEDERPRVLARLEALLAKDYHNAALRVAVADLYLLVERDDDGAEQFELALSTEPRSAPVVAERLEAFLKENGERQKLRWILASAYLAVNDRERALASLRILVESDGFLDKVVPELEKIAAADGGGAARLLLATAHARRGQPHAALETLNQIAEEKGLPAIRQALEELVELAPGFGRAYHLLADVHVAGGNGAAAAECLRKAADLAPNESGVMAPRLMKILEADPGAVDAHLLLADSQARAGERDRAIVLLRHLVRRAPQASQEALARLSLILKDDPASPRARLGAAEACLEMNRGGDALDHLKVIAETHPELSAEFLHAFAVLADAAPDQQARAVEVLRALETRSPLPLAVRFVMAQAALAGGDPSTAASTLRELLTVAPERSEEIRLVLERFNRDDPAAAEARYLLAMVYLDRRDHVAALAELARGGTPHAALIERVIAKYEQIVAAAPDDIEARCGHVLALARASRWDQVLAAGPEVLATRDDATTARVSLVLGDAMREKRDGDGAVKRYFAAYGRDRGLAGEAIEQLRGLVTAEGTHALASLAIGKIFAAEGRSSEATEALRAAVAADPKLAETVAGELQKLLEKAPGDPQPGLALIHLMHAAGDTRRVVQAVSRLLDAHPDLAAVLAGHLEQILKAEPQQPFATYEMARALQHLKLYPRSAALYLAASRLDDSLAPMVLKRLQENIEAAPTCAETYLAACAIYAAKGKFQSAAEKIQQALLKIPKEAERLLPRLEEICRQNRGNAQLNLVFAQACLRAERYEKALAAFAEAARRDPALVDAAFEGFEVIVQARPKLAEARLERARVHAQRLRADLAIADLDKTWRLNAELAPAVVAEAETLLARFPDVHGCVVLLADLHAALGREADARRLLKEQIENGWAPGERLVLLVRLWRLAAAAGDAETAQAALAEAGRLAPERNQFLLRVHEAHVAALRAAAARLRPGQGDDGRRGGDVEAVLRALLDLGDLREAAALLERHGGALDERQTARLRAEIALRRGEYPRAAEQLRGLGASRALAFGAARAGDLALAASTLETLLTGEGAEALRPALERVYREMVAADLLGGRLRLQGETMLTFGEAAGA